MNTKRTDCYFFCSRYNRPEEYWQNVRVPMYIPSCEFYDGQEAPCETCTKYLSKDEVHDMALTMIKNK